MHLPRLKVLTFFLSLILLASACKKDKDAPGPESPLISVPLAFTPNGDGVNDTFKVIASTPLVYFRLTIYDPKNSVIYMADRPEDGWDGRHIGKPAPAGSYLWVLDFASQSENRFQRKGYVELVR